MLALGELVVMLIIILMKIAFRKLYYVVDCGVTCLSQYVIAVSNIYTYFI